MRRTKIVCTIGPASQSPEQLKALMLAGMDVARLNFSHGNYEEHGERIKNIRNVAKENGKNIAILLDTKGPEIRIRKFTNDSIELNEGDIFTLTTKEILGDNTQVSVAYEGLPDDVFPGVKILIDDGLIELKVLEVTGTDIKCEVQNGGPLSNNKGVNLPGVSVSLPAMSQKDLNDIKFGIEQEVDFIAASFIRKASDVIAIRRVLEDNNSDIHIISKIENQEGLDNIEEIIKVSDGLMVARGDLGVEIPVEEVPLAQKLMIESCNRVGKPVITATQMLDSMMRNPRPTRAEASDVANAIFDGTDAIMLSGETAAGKYPEESVITMAQIAKRTEQAMHYDEILGRKTFSPKASITDSISSATCSTSQNLGAAAIITSTQSGFTAKMVSKYRPKAPVIAVTPEESVVRKLLLSWGVFPVLGRQTDNTDDMFQEAIETSLKANYIKEGDLVVITAGVPVGMAGTTNLLKVHIVGDVIVKGTGIGNNAVFGSVIVAKTAKELRDKKNIGSILVTVSTDRDLVPYLDGITAIVAEEGGLTSPTAIVGLSKGIPVVVGANGATSVLKDGEEVTVDPHRGIIYRGYATVK